MAMLMYALVGWMPKVALSNSWT